MRIIKYLFLLFLLSLVALTIYIATQKGNFTVESSKVINSPKAIVFGYVNDFKNWEKFDTWIVSDNNLKLTYSPNSSGNKSSFSWEGESDNGFVETLYTKGNDSIVQKMELNGNSSKVYWGFKDTLGGTKVTRKSVGKMDFLTKVNAFFLGKTQNSISKVYDKSLANLDKSLNLDNSTFEVQTKGIVKKLQTFYLKQSFTSKISDIPRNANVVFGKLTTFCNQNSIAQNGRPFIIYHTYDTIKDLTKVSFCIPIKEQIFTSQGSDILSGKLDAFVAVKTSLKGNYSYNKEALKETYKYVANKRIPILSTFSHLEVFTIGKTEDMNPANWQTDIYFPLTPKNIKLPPAVKTITSDTIVPSKPRPITNHPQENQEPAHKTPVQNKPAYKAPTYKAPVHKVPTQKAPVNTAPAEKEPTNNKNQEEFEF